MIRVYRFVKGDGKFNLPTIVRPKKEKIFDNPRSKRKRPVSLKEVKFVNKK